MWGRIINVLFLLKDVIPAIIDLFKKKPVDKQSEDNGKCPKEKSK